MTISNVTPFPRSRNPARHPDARTLASRVAILLYNRGGALRSLAVQSVAARGDPVALDKMLKVIWRLLREARADRQRLLEASRGFDR